MYNFRIRRIDYEKESSLEDTSFKDVRSVFDTNEMGVWVRPIQQLAKIMDEIATRASELNDPKMNALMCRLGLYAISNPDDPEYDPEATRKIIEGEIDND